MKIVFVASIIRNSLCIIYGFYYFFQKSLFAENYFLIAATNVATRGPFYTCLVYTQTLLKAGWDIYGFFDYYFQKSFFTKNYFLIAVINLTTRGPFYTCLVYSILLRFIIWVYCILCLVVFDTNTYVLHFTQIEW